MRRAELVVLVALAGCNKTPDGSHRAYPGFALDVPATLGEPEPGATYAHGVVRYRSETEVDSVTWSATVLPSDDLLPGFVHTLEAEVAPEHVSAPQHLRVGDTAALRFDIRTAPDDFWSLVAIGCGVRTIRVMVHARERGEATLQKLLAHFECRPDLAAEQAIANALPVGLDEPARVAGWKRMRTADLVLYDGAHSLSFSRGSGEEADLDRIASTLVGSKLGPRTHTLVGPQVRAWAELTTADGLPGLIASWKCPTDGVIAMAIGFEPAAARELLSAFRCPRAGEPSFAPPYAN